MSDNIMRLKKFVEKCEDEDTKLYEQIVELEYNIETLSSAIIDYNEEDPDDLTPQIRLDAMKSKLKAMVAYSQVLSDINHICT